AHLQVLAGKFFHEVESLVSTQNLHPVVKPLILFCFQSDPTFTLGIYKTFVTRRRVPWRHPLRVVTDDIGNLIEGGPISLWILEAISITCIFLGNVARQQFEVL